MRRLADPTSWATHQMARTANGERTTPESPDARSFCAYGALRVEAFRLVAPTDLASRGGAFKLAEQASKHLGLAVVKRGAKTYARDAPRTVMEWNDAPGRTHRDVIDAYERAMKTTRVQQAA